MSTRVNSLLSRYSSTRNKLYTNRLLGGEVRWRLWQTMDALGCAIPS